MHEESFICHDCKREIPVTEASEYGRGLPNPICQSCLQDLMNDRWIAEEWRKEKEDFENRPKTREEQLLLQIFGNKEGRVMRTGSSLANIEAIEQRREQSRKERTQNEEK